MTTQDIYFRVQTASGKYYLLVCQKTTRFKVLHSYTWFCMRNPRVDGDRFIGEMVRVKLLGLRDPEPAKDAEYKGSKTFSDIELTPREEHKLKNRRLVFEKPDYEFRVTSAIYKALHLMFGADDSVVYSDPWRDRDAEE